MRNGYGSRGLTPEDIKRLERIEELNITNLNPNLFQIIGTAEEDNEALQSQPYSYWRAVSKLLITNWGFVVSMILLLLIVLLAIIVPWGQQAIPVERPGASPAAPTPQYIFGLGLQGQDFWIEIWAGMRTTLLLALVLTLIQLAVGVLLGSVWGYFQATDLFFVQLTNFLSLVPQLILLLFIIFVFNVGFWPIVLGVSLQAWIAIASTVRVQVKLVKYRDYNIASVALGSRPNRILRKNILPKILPVIVQAGIFAIPNAISVDATLTFLNFGYVDGLKRTSLGKILNNVMSTTDWQVYPHLIIIPIILISLISIIFFVVAKIFADSLDPRNHR